MKPAFSLSCFLLLAASSLQAQILWTVGLDDDAWPMGDGGGANASFVQENGTINPLPGIPNSPEVNRQADNDYYFAGSFMTTIASVVSLYGDYTPVGDVPASEEAAERAFAASDNDLRYHFNLPDTLQPTDLLSVTFDANNLHTDGQSDPRYGIEVYFNGVLVQPQIIIRPPQLGTDYTTPQFTLESVNAQVGPGADNIVSLKGINYNIDGGGNWMGIDYVQLNQPTEVIPPAVFPWTVGLDDNGWPFNATTPGDGGGPNATFVQEAGVNVLPGNPNSPEADQQADDDYYFAGSYTTTIPSVVALYGDYMPVGLVPVNEEAVERAFAGDDNELRFHFNLPNTAAPNDRVAVSFDALNLHTDGQADPRYGVEVYLNGVLVQPQIIVRPPQLNQTFTTPPFTLGSVNAQVGAGFDNIVTLKGINYNAEGGGNWMGIDYVQLSPATNVIPPAVLPWSVGLNDDGWPVGDGGGTNATFVQESGTSNPPPGNPMNEELDTDADDDYYFAGAYTTVIPGNGHYVPAGLVFVNEEAVSRGFSGTDNDLRYHFNLPANLNSNDLLSVSFDALNLDAGSDPRYGVEVYFNGVLVQTQVVIRPAQLGQTITTPRFTAGSVNAQVGPGFDNIVWLKGINYNASGGGDYMGLDYVSLIPIPKVTFPWAVGQDDNAWPAGNGGGPNTTFVQESGVNPLPGRPDNPEVNQQGDDDYYFAGEYTTTIDSVVALYGPYTPIGLVLANEEGAERAFAATDNQLRYHFNLPDTLQPTDVLSVTFDALNLHIDASINPDPRYGIEVYFNGVLVQPEIIIRPPQLGVDYSTPPFTLESVNAQVGPGFDNVVTLRGINYNDQGGGNWMGIDYLQLNPVMPSPFPWMVGRDDDGWPAGDGGGPNATFVQESFGPNPLPGSYIGREVPQGADDDYYFAGVYTNVIAGNGAYEPVGLVPVNEEAAERAFAGTDNDLRYHFNLPETVNPDDLYVVTFEPLNLDDPSAVNTDPRYGVEVYFNGVLVQTQIVVRPPQLFIPITTPPFTLTSVGAELGPGWDNIVTLKGISYSAEGGGAWMGIDYVQLTPAPLAFLPPTISNNQITLNWTGEGQLEWAPAITGTWTPITPAPVSGYSENLVAGQNRFYRLRRP